MMMFDDMGFCGDLDALCGPLGEGDMAARQTEPDAVVEDDYSDEEIDVDELERRMWRDKMRLELERRLWRDKMRLKRLKECLKRLEEQSKANEVIDEGIDAAEQRRSQEQARRKKMWRAQDGILKYRLRKELMQQSKGNPRNKQGGKRCRELKMPS